VGRTIPLTLTRNWDVGISLKLAKSEPGWVRLFNGKDLTGWKTHPTQPGNWRVEGDALVSSRAAGYLFSERGDWKDFHLRAELHIAQGGNSGIVFRTPFELRPAGMNMGEQLYAPTGRYEADVFWGPVANPGRIKDFADTTDKLAEPNQWMTLEIIAQGNRLITRVNGKVAVDVVDSKSSFQSGHIALQAFTPTTNVRFRKIEIKELPPEEPGWVQLFNGTDLTGWKTELQGFPSAHQRPDQRRGRQRSLLPRTICDAPGTASI
jgi:hypothetical protein